jgi:hypothetical protein
MTQATDIVLDGAGYMLAPGKMAYKRTQDGIAEGRTGRVQIKDFFGGQLRPYQLERDRFWRGTYVGPAYNGQGVHPWGRSTFLANPADMPAINVASPMLTCVVDDHIYVAYGTKVYRTTNLGNVAWGGFVLVYTAATGIAGITYYAGKLLISHANNADVEHIVVPGGTSPTVLAAGERGDEIIGYDAYAMWHARGAGSLTNMVTMATGTGMERRYLDNKIIKMAKADGKVFAVTRSALYTFNGRVRTVLAPNPAYTVGGAQPQSIAAQEWSGDWDPFFQHGNWTDPEDHKFLMSYGGRVYTNIGRFIGEFNPAGDRAGWRDTGLHYLKCFGMESCAGFLVVCIETTDNRYQVWCWDGSGWWLLLDKANDGAPWCHPINVAGIGDWDLLIFNHASGTYRLMRLIDRGATHAIPDGGTSSFLTPLIDANERDKDKAWRKIGAVFADPDPATLASADSITVYLDYSIDAGGTWINAASSVKTGNTLANHNFTLNAEISSAAAVSRWIQLRVRWEGLVDWAPTLVNAWAEFELLDSPARRRKWILQVHAADQLIDRDGALLPVTGRQLINQLWTDWSTGTTLTFRDIDYDDVAVQRNVRITGIEEDTDRPADAGMWGDSTIRLVLVEV